MKKALLLSIAVSSLIYAGGDIAPAQPVAPQAAPAACDFWGTLAFRYDANKDNVNSFGDSANNFAAAGLAIGVEKELGYGFGFGAELGARYTLDGSFNKVGESAELSQAYITYKAGNTAIKLGRQALPQNLSPWAWSDRVDGIIDRAYNGIVIVNTDIKDTVLAGAWIASFTDDAGSVKISDNSKNKGLFMLAAEYKGIANTTLDFSAYYVPKLFNYGKTYSLWAMAQSKVSNVDLAFQAAYAKADALSSSFAVAASAGTTFGDLDAKLTLGYINDGKTPLNITQFDASTSTTGNPYNSVSSSVLSTFVDDNYYTSFGGEVNGGKQKIVKLDLGYKLPYGKLVSTIAYDKTSGGTVTKNLGAKLGYEFNVKGVDALVEYTYEKTTTTSGSSKNQRIRVSGVYKF